MSEKQEFGFAHGNKNWDLVRIHSDPTIQTDERESFGNPVETFPPSFVLHGGWDAGQGAPIVYPYTEKEAKRAVEQRKERVVQWRAEGDKGRKFVAYHTPESVDEKTGKVEPSQTIEVSYAELARFAEKLWTDAKGNYIPPTHGMNSGMRRGFALPASALALFHCDGMTADKFVVPTVERSYTADLDGEKAKFRDRIAENLQRGRSGYTDADLLTLVYKSVAYFSATEAEIMREFEMARGKAQKLHKLAKLAKAFPKLQILERCHHKPDWDSAKQAWKDSPIKDGPAKGMRPILLSAILPAEIAYLLGESGKKGAEAPELGIEAGVKLGVGATQDQTEKYFSLLYRGRSNKPKSLGESTIKELLSNVFNPANKTEEIVKQVLTAVLNGDKAPIAALIAPRKESES